MGWRIIVFLLLLVAAYPAIFIIPFVGVIVYWIFKKIVASSAQELPRVSGNDSGKISVRDIDVEWQRSPEHFARSRVADDLWISPGQTVTVGKFKIPGGMIYVGRDLPAVSEFRGDEPALIDRSLTVASQNPDYQGENMPFFSYYCTISPASRLAYLQWLELGRNDPMINVAYVFLFFYGLERRLLFEAQTSPTAKAEAPAIISEVTRLLSIYGTNSSFKRYASYFIDTIRFLFEEKRAYQYEPIYQSFVGEYSPGLRIALAQLVSDGKPIPAKWALAWYMGSPETRLRVSARRFPNEFKQVFIVRYVKAYGDGLLLKPNKTRLKLSYQPASASFSGSFSIPVGDLPDVTRLKRPLNQLTDIAEDCCNELDSYSRWLAKNADKPESLAGMALLPEELLPGQPSKEMTSLVDRLNGFMADQSQAIVEGAEMMSLWPSAKPDRMTKRETIGFIQFLEKRGFGLEPDVRFGGVSISDAIKVVLFRLPENYPVTPSSEYKAAVVLMRLAAAVAAADGSVDRSEEEHLQNHLEASLDLSHGERVRLTAFWKWLVDKKPGLAGLKTRLEKLDADAKGGLANFAVGVAVADGGINPGEVKTVRSIYKLLGMDPEQVYSDIHTKTAEVSPPPATEPVRVRTEKPGPAGFAVPQPPQSVSVQQTGFQLDKNKIAEKMAETAAVSSLLSEIFVEEEPSPSDIIGPKSLSPSAKDSVDATASIANLDGAHSALLTVLLEKASWTRIEFEELASDQGLMPDGAIDVINEASFEICDEPILEGDDPIEVNKDLMEEMSA